MRKFDAKHRGPGARQCQRAPLGDDERARQRESDAVRAVAVRREQFGDVARGDAATRVLDLEPHAPVVFIHARSDGSLSVP